MKNLFLIFLIMVWLMACDSSSNLAEQQKSAKLLYDSVMAQKAGADDYGMRRYVLALLKAGPKRDQDSAEAAQIQRAHLDNITRMAEEGKLVLAGPFFDDWGVKGIYIFAVESVEEAKELTASDPAIKAGRLEMELHPWYGSAALMMVNENHKRVAKEEI